MTAPATPGSPPDAADALPGAAGDMAAPSADGAAHLAHLARAEQLRLYQVNLRTLLPANLVLALLVTVMLWRDAGPVPLAWWWGALALALLLRSWGALGRRTEPAVSPAEALRRTRFGVWALALAWGLCGLLVPLNDHGLLLFVILVMVVLSAGTVTLAGFDPYNGIGFGVLMFAPLMLRLGLAGDTRSLTLAGLIGLHVAVTAVVSLRAWEHFKAGIALRGREAERLDTLARNEARLQQLTSALQRQTDVLHTTLDSMDQGLLGLGEDGRVRVYNRRLCELTGLPEQLLASGPTLGDIAAYQVSHGLLGPGEALVPEPVRPHFAATLQGEPGGRVPERYLRTTLQGMVLEVKSRQLGAGALVRTFTDVTAFVQAQEQLRASEAEARKLALVAAHTDNGVVILDAQRRVDWVNASFERDSGWRLAEVRGRRLRDLLFEPGTDTAALQQLDADVAERGWGQCETRVINRAGALEWVAVEMRAIRGEDGAVHQFILVARSVQARHEAEAALRAARDAALEASRAKTDFLSAMSHELRTPLNAILGFAQLLEADPASLVGERPRRYLREIHAAGNHLLDLIGDVLDLARLESGAMHMHCEPVALGGVADECLRLLRPTAELPRVRLPDTAPLAGVTVQADRRRLKQVLLNVLSNAIKYNRPGGEVRLTAAPEGGAVRVTVHDTGPGIAVADQARLFNAFERLDAERLGVEGVGVGLALSRQLVERMGGQIGIDSVPGEGSRFWFTLPAAVAAPAPAPRAPGLLRLPPGPWEGCWRVLYIEDNPVNAVLMEAMLGDDPALRLQIALLPEEGLTLARQQPPDAVLLDIQLPGIDGYEVLRRLRADPVTVGVPVIAISANAMPDDLARGRAAGFDEYLAKPLELPLLLQTLARVLTAGRPGIS